MYQQVSTSMHAHQWPHIVHKGQSELYNANALVSRSSLSPWKMKVSKNKGRVNSELKPACKKTYHIDIDVQTSALRLFLWLTISQISFKKLILEPILCIRILVRN
mmetsp:Transcript_38417/g.65638  ORF Transcript_38417/g.65638 Transcript_38417/m.65638 type:complete len:105 (+) Transcript_38417:200-514(+)